MRELSKMELKSRRRIERKQRLTGKNGHRNHQYSSDEEEFLAALSHTDASSSDESDTRETSEEAINAHRFSKIWRALAAMMGKVGRFIKCE